MWWTALSHASFWERSGRVLSRPGPVYSRSLPRKGSACPFRRGPFLNGCHLISLPAGFWADSPTSNSKPFLLKVWQQPPAFPCCSRTTTRFPALERSAAAASPPMPLPITTASRFSGTLAAEKAEEEGESCHRHVATSNNWVSNSPAVFPCSFLGPDPNWAIVYLLKALRVRCGPISIPWLLHK